MFLRRGKLKYEGKFDAREGLILREELILELEINAREHQTKSGGIQAKAEPKVKKGLPVSK